MTVRFKPFQLQEPLPIGALLEKEGFHSLTDIANWLTNQRMEGLRSHRRVLLNVLRYTRTHGMKPTDGQWTAFAAQLVALPLAWDEAKDGRYRYRIPAVDRLPSSATKPLIRASLEHMPPGWHASMQTRQHYRYAVRHIQGQFHKEPDPMSASLADSMRLLVAQKFPPPHSYFIENVLKGNIDRIVDPSPQNPLAQQSMNSKWVQTAFALARFPNNPRLVEHLMQPTWLDTNKVPMPDAGLSLSFFEIIQRLPAQQGRPPWMAKAFAQMLPYEKDANALMRGWRSVNLSEQERLTMLAALAPDFPPTLAGVAWADALPLVWTLPMEERTAVALHAYQSFGSEQVDAQANTLVKNAKEWIGLLVPELKPVLELSSGSVAEEIMQLQQFLAPAETTQLDLPTAFNESSEVGDLVPK